MSATDSAEKRRRWSGFMPRPNSSSGLPTSNTSARTFFKRPSSSSGLPTGDTSAQSFFKRPSSSSGLSTSNTTARSFFKRPSSTGLPTSETSARPFFKRPSSSSGLPTNNIGARSFFKRPSSSSGLSSRGVFRSRDTVSPVASPEMALAAFPASGSSGIGLYRSDTLNPTAPRSPPTAFRQWTGKHLLTFSKASPQEIQQPFDSQGPTIKSPETARISFGKAFPSILGLTSLSLSRTSTRESGTDEKDRGRSPFRMRRGKSSSAAPDSEPPSRSVSRARSQSPFSFRRFRHREPSPTLPQALPLSHSDAELSDTASSLLPRSTAFSDDESGDEATTDGDADEGSSGDDCFVDPITERNTERNAVIPPPVDSATAGAEIEDPDPVGEGVNIVVAPEPYFPSTLNSTSSGVRGKRNPRKRRGTKSIEALPFHTSRPIFQRDRCTITITQGDPEGKLGGRRKRRYVVASDLSEESRYAVEWGIGTVLHDGDEMWVVTVVENESKVDPDVPNTTDKMLKVRSQQERQGLAYILARQVTGLLQRTRLNVTISCQAWHAKNSRHMLLDIVDYVEPIMLVVGSRGLGHLRGILLGSTSHYLIQKCSVPVMIARRRLKRPPKKSAHLSTHRARVKLAEAGIDRVAVKVDQDVKTMRDEMQKDDNRRAGGPGSREAKIFSGINEGDPEDEPDDENDDEPVGIKVSG